jgi:hypothetical protein
LGAIDEAHLKFIGLEEATKDFSSGSSSNNESIFVLQISFIQVALRNAKNISIRPN